VNIILCHRHRLIYWCLTPTLAVFHLYRGVISEIHIQLNKKKVIAFLHVTFSKSTYYSLGYKIFLVAIIWHLNCICLWNVLLSVGGFDSYYYDTVCQWRVQSFVKSIRKQNAEKNVVYRINFQIIFRTTCFISSRFKHILRLFANKNTIIALWFEA
jgi:hypothetical protein